MEEAAGSTLFLRTRAGMQPTDAGWRLLRAAERLAEEMSRVGRALPETSKARREVGVSIGPLLAAQWLRASGSSLVSELGEVELTLTAGPDAELSVGWTRSRSTATRARSLGALGFGLYAAESYLAAHGRPRTSAALAGHSWVLGPGRLERSADARWAARMARSGTVALRAADPAVAVAAVAAGVGVGVLLQGSEDAYPELARLFPVGELRLRTVWLGLPRDTRNAAHLERAAKVIDATLGDHIRRWQRRG